MNFWTLEEDQILHKMWNAGAKVREIEVFLPGRNRNSIISRAKRINLPKRANPVKRGVTHFNDRIITKRIYPTTNPKDVRQAALDACPEVLIHFWDLDNDMCRYIPHEDRMACGRTCTGRNQYCDEHMVILCPKPTKRKKKGVDSGDKSINLPVKPIMGGV